MSDPATEKTRLLPDSPRLSPAREGLQGSRDSGAPTGCCSGCSGGNPESALHRYVFLVFLCLIGVGKFVVSLLLGDLYIMFLRVFFAICNISVPMYSLCCILSWILGSKISSKCSTQLM